MVQVHLYERPSHSFSSRQRPSRSFEYESCELGSQSQNWSDQRLCLNRFKLCDWFANHRIIAASELLVWTVFFSAFGNLKSSRTGFVLIFFSATDVIVWTSSRWSLTNILWPIRYDWNTLVNEALSGALSDPPLILPLILKNYFPSY